jgi:hypothetical protein
MNKADIKNKWGQYIDTDKLVDDMMCLLTKYNHRNSEHGVCCVLDKFFTNKEPLINLLQKSESYAGDLRIVLDEQLERHNSQYEVRNCVDTFATRVQAYSCVKKKTDASNKKMEDYFRVGKHKVELSDLNDEAFIASCSQRSSALSAFDNEGYTRESTENYSKFLAAMRRFRDVTSSIIPDENLEYLKEYKVNSGTKTSRAFNKVCHHFEVDKAPQYNKEFAKYADMVSGLKRQIKFFISVNPLDYLTMSFGVNWASCHTIDKMNVRHMDNSYSGQYCGGTMSYMLDSTSIVTYVHNEMPEDYEAGKVYRNMFHFGGEGVLLQSRIYPQGNDGCTDLYREFRYIMQREFTKLLGLAANKWTKRNSVNNIYSSGVHYRDYEHNSSCNISYPSERSQCQHQTMAVGHNGLCFYCGQERDGYNAGTLAHSYCNIEQN